MDAWDEPYTFAWDGALADAVGLPEVALAGLVLTFAHAAGKKAWDAAYDALRPVTGSLDLMHIGLRRRLVGRTTRWPLMVAAGRRRIVVRARGRLKAKQVRQLVDALAQVPGAERLRVEAKVRRFGRRAVAPVD